jgi:hypothetical protein
MRSLRFSDIRKEPAQLEYLQMKLSLLTALVIAFVAMSVAQSLESWIVRLSPAAFPELPTNLVQELQRRQCTVPQEAFSKLVSSDAKTRNSKEPNNVIKAEFARPGQTDWAVLCSVEGVSTILVFWNGSENDPAAIAPWPDRNYVTGVHGDQDWAYSRRIEPMGMAEIVRLHDQERLGIPLPPIEHQGINDADDKAFLVWYYYDGQWLKVAGGD